MTQQTNTENNNARAGNPLRQEEEALRRGDADLQQESRNNNKPTAVVEDNNEKTTPTCPFVALKMKGRTHQPSSGARNLLKHKVSLQDLTKMTTIFYENAFQDATLDQFIRSHDDPHADRFAKWIYQKLSGANVWDQERAVRDHNIITLAGGYQHVVHDRSSAHVAAWYSPKRPVEHAGRHFQLDECRVWMRLHFWAMRQAGLVEAQSPSFADYYVRFIGHFVNVYESSAPSFARDSFRWSANPANIEAYLQNGRVMKDVLGLSLEQAEAQIPVEEANDFVWPYNKSPAVEQ